jgi:amino acid adenylation domain-containing protein
MKTPEDFEESKRTGNPDRTMEKEIVVFPTSFAQQRLWFLDRLEPGSSTYNVAQAFRLTGQLQRTALERSLTEIVQRHEMLRTRFSEIEGEPAQIIDAPAQPPLKIISLLEVPAEARESEARRWIEEEAHRPFDLTKTPLFRAALLELDEAEHILLLTMHHIVSDGWSMGVLYRELSSLYEAFCRSEIPSLPDLPIQYVDYAVWQRQWLQGEVLEQQLSYWKQQLSGVPVLELPADRPRPAMRTFRGARKSAVFPKALCDELKALSRREGVTLFMTLLAAFQTLLHRYTGQHDIVVGSPIAGRTRAEIEALIGLFINTLVLRGDLSGDPKFTELLARVRKAALEAYEHQELPFEKLVEELNPWRDPSRSLLFQVMLALQNAPKTPLALTGLRVRPVDIEGETVKFDLTLSMEEGAGPLKATLGYSTDLFEQATISRMLGHFQTLLQGIVANPEQRISELPILTEAERRRLLVEWNDTKRDYPKEKCVHELFEEQAERTPNAVAVLFEGGQLTYRELNRRANQLAHHLRRLGVGPETLVGLCVERSPEMVVGLLGILKTGGAYVPLDPAYPNERLAFMLEDSQIAVLLTRQQVPDRLPEHKMQTVCVDRDREKIARESESNLVRKATEQNSAYVIYTSGTTGNPNGVVVEHRSLVNYLCWFNESPPAKKLRSLPVIARPTFDSSLKQLFAPLLRGDPVWLPPDEVANQPAALLRALTTRAMAGLNCAPSVWKTMLDTVDSDREFAPPATLVLFLGGEPLSKQLVDRTFAAFRGMEIWNLYGPTEATANATAGRMFPDSAITLGRPIANTQIYILDSRLQPVPVGVAGELCIGGVGLARGYLNRPELTAEKFVPNLFNDEPGARLYKSGDLARYLPDGNINFLGRIDDQVKIRGFRIEPGEIEAMLSRHAAVRESVVVARGDVTGEKRLVAYVVPHRGRIPATADLRSFLKSKLPGHMVPSAFVLLEALPRTPHGKLDRRALPAPDQIRPELETTFVAPQTPVEKVLGGIFADVLGIERVGIHDDFFELGGHSLLATLVVSRIRAAFKVDLPLRRFFDAPTVAGLAEALLEDAGERERIEKTARLLLDLARLSDDQVERMLDEMTSLGRKR